MRRIRMGRWKRHTGNWVDLKVVKHGKTLERKRYPANSWVDNYYQWYAGNLRPSYDHYFWLVPTDDHPSCTNKKKCICKNIGGWFESDFLTLNIAIGDSNASWAMDQCWLQGSTHTKAVDDLWFEYKSSWTNIKLKAEIPLDERFFVREVGLKMSFMKDVYGNVFHALLERSVLGAGIDVPSGGKVVVTYTIRY